MNENEIRELTINNEYDYSNIVPESNTILQLAQYCEALFNQLMYLINSDEERNEKLKYEFKDYQYKKSYNTKFEIVVKQKDYTKNFTCKTYDSFSDIVNNGKVNGAESITITLDLSYRRGKQTSLFDYDNIFKIVFKPYDVKFTRKSNHNENDMNQIENNINELFKRFKTQNTIFCTK